MSCINFFTITYRKAENMTRKSVFSAADILLPDFSPCSDDYTKWAVIACDQFTSNIGYWNETERIVGTSPSTYDYILPEAFLETPRAEEKTVSFKEKMASLDSSPLKKTVNGFIYIERTLNDGKIRRGILGMVDLEEYDYAADSTSAIRATEQTVAERIPPRSALRAMAAIELPHAMVFVNDQSSLFVKAEQIARNCPVIYDFDLMQGGGHIKGYAIEGDAAEALSSVIVENEQLSPIPYAVGDGNHSLAAAKSLYESVKDKYGDEAADHPARYALCEVVSIYDGAIEFEAIHRVVMKADAADVITELEKIASKGDGEQNITVITSNGEWKYSFTETSHDMTVGTLQNFIDKYICDHSDAVCDYIHGEDELRSLVNENSVAFMFDGFDKSNLFSYIKNGPMPRKTFSMGDARSKRYYLEARKIIK